MSDNNFEYQPIAAGFLVEETVEEVNEEVVAVEEKPSASDEVVVYALRDMAKPGATKLTQGYNVISKAQYSRWKDSKAVRLAKPDEIKKYVK
jgi:acyl-CoA-binding protein